MMVCLLPEGNWSGRSTAERMIEGGAVKKSEGDWIDLVSVEFLHSKPLSTCKCIERESQKVRHRNQPFRRWLVTDSSYKR